MNEEFQKYMDAKFAELKAAKAESDKKIKTNYLEAGIGIGLTVAFAFVAVVAISALANAAEH